MEPIITTLIIPIQFGEYDATSANGKANDIDCGKNLVLEKISKGNFEKIL
jgi:hypothetical protein